MSLKTQIIVVGHTFEEACEALAKLCGEADGKRLQGLLEAHCGVSIDEERRVWLQQESDF